jgi:hypothetical protein
MATAYFDKTSPSLNVLGNSRVVRPLATIPAWAKRPTTSGVYRAKVEVLLGRADAALLSSVWQEVFPCVADKLPDRRGMIEDLADFAEVLRPQLAGMRPNQLCRLIQANAAGRKRSQRFLRRLIAADGSQTPQGSLDVPRIVRGCVLQD